MSGEKILKSDRTAVSPTETTRFPPVSTRFRALQHRNFQLFIAGQLISLIGTWMQTTAQLWLVYKLTGSAALLGVFGFASQVPMLFLSSLGGYVGDRYERHRGVIATQTASMILAFVLAALTLAHLINEWELIAIAFLVGVVNAFDVPIRQAFLVQMVGKEDLPNAIALNSSILDRKSTRLNSSHDQISYAVFCLKKKKKRTSTSTSSRYCTCRRA